MRLKFLFLFLFSLQLNAASDLNFFLGKNLSYQQKINQLNYLGNKAFGYRDIIGHGLREKGLWGGIIVQTKWQIESNRTNMSVWSIVNGSLSTLPYQIFRELEDGNQYICQEFYGRFRKACQTWKSFFVSISKKNIFRRKLSQHLLWKAHTDSILAVMDHYRSQFKNFRALYPKEFNYWINWIEIVFWVEKTNLTSTDLLIKPLAKILNAQCAPLDYCINTIRNPIKRNYAKLLTKKRNSIARMLRIYSN